MEIKKRRMTLKKIWTTLLTLTLSLTMAISVFAEYPEETIETEPVIEPGPGGGEVYGQPLTDLPGFQEYDGLSNTEILARLIYGEAEAEPWVGKTSVAYVVRNRVIKNLPEFGGSTYRGVMLKTFPDGSVAFAGLQNPRALKPNINSNEWRDSVNVAGTFLSYQNLIGGCLWFWRSDYYNSNSRSGGSLGQVYLGGKWQYVTEKWSFAIPGSNNVFFNIY